MNHGGGGGFGRRWDPRFSGSLPGRVGGAGGEGGGVTGCHVGGWEGGGGGGRGGHARSERHATNLLPTVPSVPISTARQHQHWPSLVRYLPYGAPSKRGGGEATTGQLPARTSRRSPRMMQGVGVGGGMRCRWSIQTIRLREVCVGLSDTYAAYDPLRRQRGGTGQCGEARIVCCGVIFC